ncbi:MAG: phage holin family protein [Bryobacterales bacterium]|nr:phage holin family protein [Bryobacterales bacterium]
MSLLIRWLVTAVSLLIVAYLIPGFQVSGIKAALIAAVVIGLVNATIGLLLKIVTFPLTLLTLGVFYLVINALMLMLASQFVDGFKLSGFWAAFFGGIVLSLVSAILHSIFKPSE